MKTKQNNRKYRWSFVALFAVAFLLACITALVALLLPSIHWLQTAALILWVALFFVPFLPIIQSFDEIGIPGVFSAKLRQSVAIIQQRQLLNQVVTVTDDVYYWIDSSEIARPLRDLETAQFLSQGKGIIRLSSDEWKSIEKSTEHMPSFIEATPMENGDDKFILYNNVLYYQRSLAFLYKLAALQNVSYGEGVKMGTWTMPDGRTWMQTLKPDHFKNHAVV
jgi:hypothetical protein